MRLYMKRPKIFLLSLFALLLGIASQGMAEDCAGAGRIGEGEKKFSVVLAKAAGMAAQSFNDIGCAVISRNSECASRASAFDAGAKTYDYRSGEELPVEKAYFLMQSGEKTPRGFGIVAFKDKAEAENFAAARGKGKVIKWLELVEEKLQ